MTKPLHELIEEVVDRETFLTFARELMNDRIDEVRKEQESPANPYGPGWNGWENVTIEAFLEAAIAWTEDSAGSAHALPAEPSWRSFAQFLWAGKHYE